MEETFRNEKKRSKITIYQIIYRSRAKRQYKGIQRELQKYYRSTSTKFYNNLNYKLNLLKVNPRMYQIYKENSNQRKIPLMYGYYLTYIIKENIIYISDILNSKRNQ